MLPTLYICCIYSNALQATFDRGDPGWYVLIEANNKELEYEIKVDIACNI